MSCVNVSVLLLLFTGNTKKAEACKVPDPKIYSYSYYVLSNCLLKTLKVGEVISSIGSSFQELTIYVS